MRPTLEVADIFRRHGDTFRAVQGDRHSHAQRRVMAAIEAGRTAMLGGHVERRGDCRPGFFLPVRVLSRLYRHLFLEHLQAAFDAGDLKFFGDLAPLSESAAFAEHLKPMRRIKWVVYAKRPFAGPQKVLDYLGRYTHRVAIANSRLLACENGQ